MKKITLFLALCGLSVLTFGQTPEPNCPRTYRRSNGNGSGACGIGQLTLLYDVCPTNPGIIDSVYVNGVLSNVTFSGPISGCDRQGRVFYCITSGNMPPTGVWTIFFRDVTVSGPNRNYACNVNEGGPLPINLSSFYAKRADKKVLLSWTTDYEQNAQGFEVQRSTDGKDFTTVGFVNAANRSTGSSYSFTDIFTGKTTVQYRLRLVDLDGTSKYSEIRIVKGTGALSDFNVFPNPSNGDTRVSISDITEGTEVQVLDNSGKIIRTIMMKNSSNVAINGLQNGVYMIRIINRLTGETNTKKLTVIN